MIISINDASFNGWFLIESDGIENRSISPSGLAFLFITLVGAKLVMSLREKYPFLL